MSAAQRWPIRLDHCFMRVCLDAACGRPWTECIERPAIRHAPEPVLRRAVAVAEHLIAVPADLSAFNRRSLEMRGMELRGRRQRRA